MAKTLRACVHASGGHYEHRYALWLSICYSRPRIAPAIAEDCYILAVLYLFSHHRFFDVPGPIFAKLCHTTRCVLKYFISSMGVHMCPLKFEGRKTPISADLRTQNWHWSPPSPNVEKIRKSKTIVSICGYVRTSIPNMVGVSLPHPRNRLSPRCVGWGR